MITIVKILLPIYGLLLIAGGTMGYVSKGSLASLVAGGISGVLALVSFAVARKCPRTGFILGLVVAAGIGTRFTLAYMKTPSDLALGIASLSFVLAILLLVTLFSGQKKSS